MVALVMRYHAVVLIAANSVLAQHQMMFTHQQSYTQQAKGLNNALHLQACLSVQSLNSLDSTLPTTHQFKHLTQRYIISNACSCVALMAAIY